MKKVTIGNKKAIMAQMTIWQVEFLFLELYYETVPITRHTLDNDGKVIIRGIKEKIREIKGLLAVYQEDIHNGPYIHDYE
jgi:hypothetical protein